MKYPNKNSALNDEIKTKFPFVIKKISANLKVGEDEELMENIYDLKFMLKHIEQKNKLNWRNFF